MNHKAIFENSRHEREVLAEQKPARVTKGFRKWISENVKLLSPGLINLIACAFVFYCIFFLRSEANAGENSQSNPSSHPICQQLLADINLDPESLTWRKITTRFGVVNDPTYLSRLHLGFTRVFVPALNAIATTEEYLNMLRDLHNLVVAGADGSHVYWGSSHPLLSVLTLNYARPGLFRHEVFRHQKSFRWRNFIPIQKLDASLDLSEKFQDPFQKQRGDSQRPPESADLNLDTLKLLVRTPLVLGGVPAHELPYRTRIGNRILYEHAPVNAGPTYLNLCAEEFFKLLNLVKQNSKWQTLSPHLARYIQLAINGHVFNKANFSIFMTQVNLFLRLVGHPGVPHGHLDYFAMIDDEAAYHARFFEVLKRSSADLPLK